LVIDGGEGGAQSTSRTVSPVSVTSLRNSTIQANASSLVRSGANRWFSVHSARSAPRSAPVPGYVTTWSCSTYSIPSIVSLAARSRPLSLSRHPDGGWRFVREWSRRMSPRALHHDRHAQRTLASRFDTTVGRFGEDRGVGVQQVRTEFLDLEKPGVASRYLLAA